VCVCLCVPLSALMLLCSFTSLLHIPSCPPPPAYPLTHPATWSLPALQLTVDWANVLLLRRTSNVHTAHSEGNKNMSKIFCFVEQVGEDVTGEQTIRFETHVNLYLTHFLYLSGLAKFITYFFWMLTFIQNDLNVKYIPPCRYYLLIILKIFVAFRSAVLNYYLVSCCDLPV